MGKAPAAPGIVRVIPPSPTIKPRPLLGRQRPLVSPPPTVSQKHHHHPQQHHPVVAKVSPTDVDLASTPFGGAHQQQLQQQQQQQQQKSVLTGAKQRNSWKNRANKWQWIFSSSRGSKEKDNDDAGSRDSSASSDKSNPVHRNNSSGSGSGSTSGSAGGVKLCELRRRKSSSSNNVSCPDITSALAASGSAVAGAAITAATAASSSSAAASGPESPSPSSTSNSPFRVSLTSLFGRASSQPRTLVKDSGGLGGGDRTRVRVERSSSSSSSYGGGASVGVSGARFSKLPPQSCVQPLPSQPPHSYTPPSVLSLLARGDSLCYDSDAERCNREVDEIMSGMPLSTLEKRYSTFHLSLQLLGVLLGISVQVAVPMYVPGL